MTDQLKVKNSTLRLMKGDLTDYEIDAFVYYAQHSLALGSGFGTAIAMRGGPTVQEELKERIKTKGPLKTTEVAISSAGNMKAKRIIHAVGPRFQEEGLEEKLVTTIKNVLAAAEAEGIKRIAFPPMGAGFYGVPLPISAKVTIDTIRDCLQKGSKIEEVVIFLLDNRDYKPFQEKLNAVSMA
ncbi:MAG: macro domain-containing protein [Planctomycetota bacterium]